MTLRDFIFIGIIKLSCFYFAISYLFAKRTPTKIENCAIFWLLITFAFACVLIHGLHLKWSLRSSCLTTFGMFSFSYLVN